MNANRLCRRAWSCSLAPSFCQQSTRSPFIGAADGRRYANGKVVLRILAHSSSNKRPDAIDELAANHESVLRAGSVTLPVYRMFAPEPPRAKPRPGARRPGEAPGVRRNSSPEPLKPASSCLKV